MDMREQLESAFMKDRHSSVRVLFQETWIVGNVKDPSRKQPAPVYCAFMALYVMDLGILCADTKVLGDKTLPEALRVGVEKRVLETHEFPAAVRRSIVLADEVRAEMTERVRGLLGDSYVDV